MSRVAEDTKAQEGQSRTTVLLKRTMELLTVRESEIISFPILTMHSGTPNDAEPTPMMQDNYSLLQQPLPEFISISAAEFSHPVLNKAAPVTSYGDLANIPTSSPSLEDVEIANSSSSVTNLSAELVSMSWQGPLFISSFFDIFHPCHPFLLPRPQFLNLIRSRPLPHLVLAIQYAGSFYHPSASHELAREAASNALAQVQTKDGFYVQAMLLMTLGLQSAGLVDQSNAMITAAADVAMQLGMNKREYAWLHGNGSSQMEECWRRTWWELYVVYGCLAGMNYITFRLSDVEADCLLPCEEDEYESGVSLL